MLSPYTCLLYTSDVYKRQDLDPAAHGYRPGRGAGQAIQTVLILLRQGYTDVVDADLSKYFDTIPHDELMQSIARRIVDADMLRLIKQWLKAPVETTDGDGKRRMEGGKAVSYTHLDVYKRQILRGIK